MGIIVKSGTPDEEELLDIGPQILIPVDRQFLPPIFSAAGTDPDIEEERKEQLKTEFAKLRSENDPSWAAREKIRNELAHRGKK